MNNLEPRAKIGDRVVIKLLSPQEGVVMDSKHEHNWRQFKRDDDAIPLWTDCLTCNARRVKATLRGVYSRHQFTLPKEERDQDKIITYTN